MKSRRAYDRAGTDRSFVKSRSAMWFARTVIAFEPIGGTSMKLILIAVLIGRLTITSYRSVPNQTDSSPFYTSTGEHVRAGGCAISRDQLCGACRRLHHRCKHPENPTKLHYGDWLYIEKYGYRQINDVMGKREHYWIRAKGGRKKLFRTIRRALDIWVEKRSEEHSVNVKHLKVYKVKEEFNAERTDDQRPSDDPWAGFRFAIGLH